MPDYTLEAQIKATSGQAEGELKKFDKQLEQVGTTASKTGGPLGGLGKIIGGISPVSLTAAGGLGLLAAGLKISSSAAAEAEVIQSQLNAVLKSTEGIAGMTAGEINQLATELSAMSGVDDEAIVKAQALLLTYTNIGENVFPRTTEAALNMSAVLGQDLQSSITQLGKALNNPVEGLTALQRVGIRFTQAQQDQIKVLVESGQVMKAQTIILD